MDNLIFSLNATVPIFLLMVLGYVLNRIGWFDDDLAEKVNKFVFRIPLPVMLFVQLATIDIRKAWDTKFVLFCFGITCLSVLLAWLLSFALKKRELRGEFVQAAYRSSAAILGVAFITNIYGSSAMAPLMIIGAVPLYNIMAVVVLELSSPSAKGLNRAVMKKTIRGVLTNPILIGIVIGLLWSLLRIPLPKILNRMLTDVGNLATPLGLMAMGAVFDWKKARGELRPALGASLMKLFGFAALFLPLAILCGFRTEKLVAILVMLGSATTVSSYVMARNMNHEGVLTSSTVMLTTLLSSFSLTFWLWLLKTLSYL
ncbi:MAG: AEC family transporter [Acutalibacteraceae bacterium]